MQSHTSWASTGNGRWASWGLGEGLRTEDQAVSIFGLAGPTLGLGFLACWKSRKCYLGVCLFVCDAFVNYYQPLPPPFVAYGMLSQAANCSGRIWGTFCGPSSNVVE